MRFRKQQAVLAGAWLAAAGLLASAGSGCSSGDSTGGGTRRSGDRPKAARDDSGAAPKPAKEGRPSRAAGDYRQLARLARQGDADNLPLFRRQASHANWKRRHAAVVGIGRLKQSGDPEFLVTVVRNREERPEVRAAAAESLGVMRYYEAGPALIDALEDGSEMVRNNAGIALKKIMQVDFGYRARDPAGRRGERIALIRRRWPDFYASRPHVQGARE